MNRIVILGNGFDLAHGLSTSYNDFLLDYLKIIIDKTYREHPREFAYGKMFSTDFQFDENISVRWVQTDTFSFKKSFELLKNSESINELFENNKTLNLKFENKFIDGLIKKIHLKNWVDIESEYYEVLKGIAFKNNVDGYEYDFKLSESIDILNKDFENLRALLEDYITRINDPSVKYTPINTLRGFSRIFKSPLNNTQKEPETTLFLNFNYTTVIDLYEKILNNVDIKNKHIQIHGSVYKLDNPIIFGYGDENDNSYQKIEELNENKYFNHFKSFKYSKTRNYIDLVKFIESSKYEVFVIGHSLGMSDAVLLKYLFENDNCEYIKLFYYKNEDNFDELTRQISRHFTDKQKLREKIISFDKKAMLCPQYDDD